MKLLTHSGVSAAGCATCVT